MNNSQTITDSVLNSRIIEQQLTGQTTADGAGVKLTRLFGQALQKRLDPFLMLDAFGSDSPRDYIGGFPDHPHRGFETMTYLIAGRMRHSDNAGHQGLLQEGGMQWMTAGRGIIHSEMPEQQDGLLEGFQLWINLPADAKMQPPAYRDVDRQQLPELATADGVTVRVIAGDSHGLAGAIQRPVTEPTILDISLPAGSGFSQALPATHTAFFVVYRGEVTVGDQAVARGRLAILADDPAADGVRMRAPQDSRVLLVSGAPLRQPIAQHGPFVMNTPAQIQQAIDDYRTGRLTSA
ncbi:pirin family protein [Methylomonas sp. SURF-2]|uniref:Pirin family protein n=1 Tax=Methylomonas subterranea TaxID=2952225 RepID=A0ABT1TJL3_9GAMM|nr:pirin family protein [Methylomonas sp. SURF-2]MCQ8105630.1 pirin family protein [Methylomonas sp. SURF-2]